MKNMLEIVIESIHNGKTIALATIVRAKGSIPREIGTKMIVFSDGTTLGTVGGGEMEGRVIQEALSAIQTGQPHLVYYSYRGTEERSGKKNVGENEVFIDIIKPENELLIVGAGHVGQAVAELGAFLGMNCVVVDHRPEFANLQRFAHASRIIVDDIVQSLRHYPITQQTYIVIVTRGDLDTEVLGEVIHSPAAYIGLIGSRRKTEHVFDEMRKMGVEQNLLDRIHAPIGLGIGAETPEEIAVSILGQVIAVIHGKT